MTDKEQKLDEELVDVSGLSVDQIEDVLRHVRGLQDGPETYESPRRGWTCFHCGETFRTEEGASLHFGTVEDAFPRCAEGARKAFKMLTDRAAEQAIAQADRIIEARKEAVADALPYIERRAQEKLLRDMLAFFKGNSPDVAIFARARGLTIPSMED